MPRIKRGFDEPAGSADSGLAERLADELRHNRESGQPRIDEQEFPTGRLKVTVVWDEWDRLALEDRTAVILRAYELAEGRDYRGRIALASGLTVPEAHAAGLLPFQIIPAVRRGDPVTADQCRAAMIEEGASTLFGADRPVLRFPTAGQAEAARLRLARRLAASEPVWVVNQDEGRVEDAIQA